MYLIRTGDKNLLYSNLRKVSDDYGVSVFTLRESRRDAMKRGAGWRYLIRGEILIEDVEIIKHKTKRGGK